MHSELPARLVPLQRGTSTIVPLVSEPGVDSAHARMVDDIKLVITTMHVRAWLVWAAWLASASALSWNPGAEGGSDANRTRQQRPPCRPERRA